MGATRMRGRRRSALAIGVALLGASLVMGEGAGAVSASLSFGPTGLEGGGFVNVIAVDPSGSGLVIAGGDVSGFHRSTDWGETWQTANTGITDINQLGRSRKAAIRGSRGAPPTSRDGGASRAYSPGSAGSALG